MSTDNPVFLAALGVDPPHQGLKMTLRQDTIETAARAARLGRAPVDSTWLAEWLEWSGAASGVARRHGLDREGLQSAVDRLSWSRLVSAVNSAANP